jgi:hypothetical protein
MASADLDGDGKTDLVAGDNDGSKIVLFKNTGSSNAISFAGPHELVATSSPEGVAVGDLDGDGQVDIATALINNNLAVFKNIGAMQFAPKTDYTPGSFYGSHMLAIGDLNGDGKNDIVVTHGTSPFITVYLNHVKPEPFITSFTPTIGNTGTTITIDGYNFNNVSSVSFGGTPATSFTVNSPTSITAIVGAGASGSVSVTNNSGTGTAQGFVFGNPPIITSLSAAFDTAGASIVISGKNFSLTPDSNIVYFGAAKAHVAASSTTAVTVIVPAGATYSPVSITVNHLTAYSVQPFCITFRGGSSSFSPNTFAPRLDYTGGGRGTLCDIDGDGKSDLVFASGSAGVRIKRNLSIPGNIALADSVTFTTSASTSGVTTGDLDGDGKPDIITYNSDANSISILRNESSPGQIALDTSGDYLTGPSTTNPSAVIIRDLDADGKPDIIVTNYYAHTISVFKNISTLGKIMLDTRIDYLVNGYPTGIDITDADGDGMPDMIASVNGEGIASVFRNISAAGTISFEKEKSFPAGSWPNDVAASDVDGDNKPDIVIANINSNTISILRNLSTKGNVVFDVKNDIRTGDGPFGISIGDLDGDGKPDITEQNIYSGLSSSVLKNTSTAGSVSFQPGVDYTVKTSPIKSSLGDIDGDGIPDMVVYAQAGNYSIFRNLGKNTAADVKICSGVDTVLLCNVTGSAFQWQQNKGNGFENIVDDSIFSGTNTAKLKLSKIPVSLNNYTYRCLVNGSVAGNIYSLNITTSVVPAVSITSTATNICKGTNVTFTGTIINGGPLPVYHWKLNGTDAGSNEPTYNSNALSNGDSVSLTVTSNEVCAVPATVNSNTVFLTVSSMATPSVTISASSTNICTNVNPAFVAHAKDLGSAPIFQWKKNGINVGINDSVYSSNDFKDGDAVYVSVIGNSPCSNGFVATSDTILLSAKQVTPTILINGNTRLQAGQSSIITATVTNGGSAPMYQWQDSTSTHTWMNISGTFTSSISYIPALTDNQLRCILTSSSGCASPASVTSNVLKFIIDIDSAQNNTIRHYPDPVTSSLVIDKLNPLDNWLHVEIRNMAGNLFIKQEIAGETKVNIQVSSLARGVYIAILTKQNGKQAYFKFIKQ